MKTNTVPLKSPIKLPPEMKKILIFQNLLVFRVFFEKAVVLENGQIWNQSIFLNETFRRASSLRFNKNGGIVDERCPHLMPATPIFPKHWFFKKGPKNQQILKNSKFFLHFWWQFYRAFQWYIVCFHTFSGCWYTEGNVFAIKSHPATTV